MPNKPQKHFRKTVSDLWTLFCDGVLFKNPVLIRAISLCPVIAASYTLKHGVTLAACTAIVLVILSPASSLAGRFIPAWLMPPVYTLLAMGIVTGEMVLLREISPAIQMSLFLFIPLIAVNSLISTRAGRFAVNNSFPVALVDALANAIGFAFVICIASALKEMAALGSLWGINMPWPNRFPAASHPFGALILIGFMAALVQGVNHFVAKRRK